MFSIIIPTYDRPSVLRQCLDCVVAAVSGHDDIEVIVSDDAWKEATATMMKAAYPKFRYLRGPSKGPAANRNFGASHAVGEWLVFTDDDCLPHREWIAAYRASINDARVLEGKTIADRPRLSLDEESPLNESGGYLWSCNFAIKKELFQQLNGFDESFPFAAMEDVDLRKRIQLSSELYTFVPNAVVVHPWRKAKGIPQEIKARKSRAFYWSKHPDERPISISNYYLHLAARSFIRVTLPGAIRYRGRGILFALRRDLFLLRSAFSMRD